MEILYRNYNIVTHNVKSIMLSEIFVSTLLTLVTIHANIMVFLSCMLAIIIINTRIVIYTFIIFCVSWLINVYIILYTCLLLIIAKIIINVINKELLNKHDVR